MIIFSVLSWLGGGTAYYILLNLYSYTDTIIKVTLLVWQLNFSTYDFSGWCV